MAVEMDYTIAFCWFPEEDRGFWPTPIANYRRESIEDLNLKSTSEMTKEERVERVFVDDEHGVCCTYSCFMKVEKGTFAIFSSLLNFDYV